MEWRVEIEYQLHVPQKRAVIQCETEESALIMFAASCKIARCSGTVFNTVKLIRGTAVEHSWAQFRLDAYNRTEHDQWVEAIDSRAVLRAGREGEQR